MASRSTTKTCCLTLPLLVEKWQSDRLNTRLECARNIYNAFIGFELKKLRHAEANEKYAEIQSKLKAQYALEKKRRDVKLLKDLYKERKSLLRDAGITEYAFKTDMKDFYKHYSPNIKSSVAVHGIASRAWTAFERYLYGNGKRIHFKRFGEIRSIRGYSANNGKSGGLEIIYRGEYVEWNGLRLRIKHDLKNEYEGAMLEKRVKYCAIKKVPGKTRDRWYVQLMLEGDPVIKPTHHIGTGPVGIDIGPQTIAYVSQNDVNLIELADGVLDIEREKNRLQRKMDRSLRANNPDNYAENGTIRKGRKLTWKKSKRYKRLQHKLAVISAEQAAIRKRQHTALANYLLTLGDRFYVEDMSWQALTRRAKKTEISEKTGKYKRKKRFGKSVANKAPAMLIGILDQKLKSRGLGSVTKVPLDIKASQYCHLTGEYHKKGLSQRWNYMPDGNVIQRDLYSAFLLAHVKIDMEDPDKYDYDNKALYNDYESFVALHDKCIANLMTLTKTISSMGIRANRTHT